ncbi:MAG: hypothetical protein JWO90_98 [Solirubrobacterales bacterium]|jgi:hypothetical protein|nr:hypothetical protein [Solirubrobacterales bacterium]
MTTKDLHPLLDPLVDTREVIVVRAGEDDLPLAVWRTAVREARRAYASWSASPGRLAHAAYLAAEDQADAALEGLLLRA